MCKNYSSKGEPLDKASDGKVVKNLGGKTAIIVVPIVSEYIDDAVIYAIRQAMDKHNAGGAIIICNTEQVINTTIENLPYAFKYFAPSRVDYIKNDQYQEFKLLPTISDVHKLFLIMNERLTRLETFYYGNQNM